MRFEKNRTIGKRGYKSGLINSMQKCFSFFLNPVSLTLNKISKSIKSFIITACCFALVGYFVLYFTPSADIRFRLTYDHIICGAVLIILTLFSIEGSLKNVRWNKLVFYVFFLSGFGIILTSFLHPVGSGYRAFGMMLMVGFPCMYYVWNNRADYERLYKRLSAATAAVGILYYCYCFYRADKGELSIIDSRVTGTFYDSNMFSMIGMIMVCSSLYMLLVNRNSKLWFLLAAMAMGAGISIVKMGVSRLAILVVLGSMVAFPIYYLKTQSTFTEAAGLVSKLIRAELLLVAVIVFVLVGNLMLSLNARAIEAKQIPADSESAAIETETEQLVETEQQTDAVAEGESETLDPMDRFNTDGMDIDAYTAGRYHIWQGYAQYLNLTGNDFSKADWAVLTRDTVRHAHNNFLEIAFRCGVPVACLHILLELMAGIICLIWLFNPKYKEPYYLFSIVFMICYTVQSLFDIATLPFERPAPFYFYMMMIPVFTFGTERKEELK